jgi:hypothetical protein
VKVEKVFEHDGSFENALYEVAEGQLEADHFFLAIITAQAAVEAVAEALFTMLFGLHLPRSMQTMMKVLPDRTFKQEGTRRLWTELTGDNLTSHPSIWKPYDKHIDRRNRAAHGGGMAPLFYDPLTRDDARASIDACRAFTTHLHKTFWPIYERLIHTGADAAKQDQWRALSVLAPRRGDGLITPAG